DALIYRLIRERRRTKKDTGDLLSMLLAVRDEETGEGLTDREVRDQVITFIGAGHETTAVALAWTWYLLATHPAVEERLRAELAAVLGGRTPAGADPPPPAPTRRVVGEARRGSPPL